MVAMILAGRATIGQGNCNHWDCPKCGVKRAKQEYRRIVSGCETLAMGHELYFWTLTCRGKECSLEEAEEHYYDWTNVLLTNARTKCNRAGYFWSYVQITERQKKTRHHPHSHIITTFCPDDATVSCDKKGRENYVSAWFIRANVSAGLGVQARISGVQTAAGVSRYVAKYMFKDTMTEKWPAKWKRVRYAQSFPKLQTLEPDFVAILLSQSDWDKAERQRVIFTCETPADYERARHHMAYITCAKESSQLS